MKIYAGWSARWDTVSDHLKNRNAPFEYMCFTKNINILRENPMIDCKTIIEAKDLNSLNELLRHEFPYVEITYAHEITAGDQRWLQAYAEFRGIQGATIVKPFAGKTIRA